MIDRRATVSCVECGAEFEGFKGSSKYCSDCRKIASRRNNNRVREKHRAIYGQVYIPKVKPVVKPKKIILTDKEQLIINRCVDNLHNMELETRVIRPGDADFEAIAALYNPPTAPQRFFSVSAEVEKVDYHRRRENTGVLR